MGSGPNLSWSGVSQDVQIPHAPLPPPTQRAEGPSPCTPSLGGSRLCKLPFLRLSLSLGAWLEASAQCFLKCSERSSQGSVILGAVSPSQNAPPQRGKDTCRRSRPGSSPSSSPALIGSQLCSEKSHHLASGSSPALGTSHRRTWLGNDSQEGWGGQFD